MKKKTILTIVIVAIITMISTMCFATDEAQISEDMLRDVETQNEIMPINEEVVMFEGVPITEMEGVVTVEADPNEINDDVYLSDENVTASNKTIYGNQFIVGNDVKIEGETIDGDLFVTSENLEISEDTTIKGNVFVCANNFTLYGNIEKSAFIIASTFDMKDTSEIRYALNLVAETVKISGVVNRDANITGNDLQIDKTGMILGNLNYYSDKEAIIDGNVIGTTNFSNLTEKKSTLDVIYDYAIRLLRTLIFTLIFMIVIIKVFPKYITEEKEFKFSTVCKNLGKGLLAFILIPLCSLLLMFLDVTLGIGLILIPVFIVLLGIANAVSVIEISKYINKKVTKFKLPILVTVSTIIVWAIEQIPLIGIIVTSILILLGLGIIVSGIFKRKE